MTSLLTNSRAKVARSCARKHHFEYELGFRAVAATEDLDFGNLIHELLAAWWLRAIFGVDVEERLTAAMALLETKKKLDLFVRMRALTMLNGYHARWCNEPFYALSVEQTFEGPLINPDTGAESKLWRLAGKLDVVVIDADGKKWLIEHKTSNEDLSPGGFYWRRLRMDPQVSIYFDGAKLLGHDVAGCIYDVLGKHTLRPKLATPVESRKFTAKGALYANQRDTDETPEEYCARLVEATTAKPEDFYVRIEVPRLESELDDARRDLWQQAQRIREDERLKRAPRNPDACSLYGKTCPFFDVCSGAASLDDQRLFNRSAEVHPELAT